MSLYQILELQPSASINDIKKSYRRLAKIYHPDKNKSKESIVKFQQINSAYDILINDKSRQEYLSLNSESKTMFQEFLEKIFANNLNSSHLEAFGIKLNGKDLEYLNQNFYQAINSLNLIEIINFFKSGYIPKKDFEFNNLCSDSEIDSWGVDDPFYFFNLPLEMQKHNSKSLRINLNITIEDILSNSKKTITLKRQINKKFINTNFEFNCKSPLIIFNGGGDIEDDTNGDLIVKLTLPENYDWHEDLIIYQHNITLFQYVYGVDFSFKIGNKELKYNNWVPSREGNIIFIEDLLKEYNKNFSIKFILSYNDNEDKKMILNNYFN